MSDYMLMAQVIQAILDHGLWWLPGCILAWRLPNLVTALAAWRKQ